MIADECIALGARDLIAALSIPNLTVKADIGVPSREQKLPLCDIFVAMDDAAPRHDGRTGTSHYIHSITLAVELTVAGNSQREAKAWLATAGEMVLDALLSRRDWAKRDGSEIIEGFGSLRRGYLAPPDGDQHIVKLQLELKVLIASQYSPSADLLPALNTLSTGIKLDVGGDEVPIGITIEVPQA